jgi:hypothetical protein
MPPYESFYWYPGKWRGHVREYVYDDLQQMANYLGLEIAELRGCHHLLSRVPTAIRPAYLLATKVFSGWRDSWSLVARKPADWQPNTEISQEKIARILAPVSYLKP